MFEDFKSMILHGKIPYEEAREMSPLWVEKELIPISENKS
jgi:formate dehydrogenase subunit gamma